jgi:1,4-alpha-glucan branching enzyme
MHDTLEYLHRDPIHRRWHHEQLTFRSLYLASEQFVLPLSHDEVVHGKGSLFEQMFGDERQRLAGLRLLYGLQLLQPGKKLLFMGDELGQRREWAHDRSLDWSLLDDPGHAGLARFVAALNELYRAEPSLHRDDQADRGLRWLEADDRERSVFCAERHDGRGGYVVIVCNATPEPRTPYRVGLPVAGAWTLRCSSDDERFGGDGHPVPVTVDADARAWHDRPHSVELSLPPLGFVVYAPVTTDHGARQQTH